MKTKKKTVKHYKTHNLDETAYIALRGHKPKVRAIDGTSATFTFEDKASVRKLVKEFYTKNSRVPIHSWLATRTMIKKETQYSLKFQIMKENRRKNGVSPIPGVYSANGAIPSIPQNANTFYPKIGENYFYVDPSKNIINNLFAASRIHQARTASNRCFRTKAEAESYALTL